MTTNKPAPTLWQTMLDYLDMKRTSRGENTYLSYRNGVNFFCKVLEANGIHPMTDAPDKLTEEMIVFHIKALSGYSTRTENQYTTAINGYYEYLAAEGWPFNLARVRILIRQPDAIRPVRQT